MLGYLDIQTMTTVKGFLLKWTFINSRGVRVLVIKMSLSSIFQLYHGGQLQKICNMFNTLFSPFQLDFLFLKKLSETSTKIKYNTSITYWLKAVNDFETWSKLQMVAKRPNTNCSSISWRQQDIFDDMMVMFVLYLTNTPSWIFIAVAH